MADQPPRKRRWFSFSLRTFLAGVFLIAIVLMPLAHRWHRYHQQKATIKSSSGVSFHNGMQRPWWRYLLTGEEIADDVRGITLTTYPPNYMDSVRSFDRLESLCVVGVERQGVFTSDLTLLAGLTQLQELDLAETNVNDITPLADVTQLQKLDLAETKVTDITPLAGLTQLQRLDLEETKVTDITPLAGLTQLQELNLRGTNVTDLTPLAGLTQLKSLTLTTTGVTDTTPLAGLTRLQRLYLWNTKVTDLTPLAKLANVDIHIDDHEQLTIPVELQGRVYHDRPIFFPDRVIQGR